MILPENCSVNIWNNDPELRSSDKLEVAFMVWRPDFKQGWKRSKAVT